MADFEEPGTTDRLSAQLTASLSELRSLVTNTNANLDRLNYHIRSQNALLAQDHIRQLLNLPRYTEPKRLSSYEHKVYSQGGEDGIIAEIFRRIGTTSQAFVEIGVENGLENNTLNLLLQGWRGGWIEASADYANQIGQQFDFLIASGQLVLQRKQVSPENIDAVLAAVELNLSGSQELDLLSIDIDGYDYWVWEAIRQLIPRVVVIEYNASFSPPIACVMEYKPGVTWNGTNYFGASLKALERLAERKGYKLVGCNLAGINAFFVRNDLVEDKFASPYTAENHYEPPRYFLLGYNQHPSGFGKFQIIE